MEKKLEVKDLQISFRTQGGILKAVRNISFDLYKGETLAIVGESGSGKSVTSKAIMGILAGNSIVEGGEILYDGQDLIKIEEEDFHKIRGDKIAMIFQDPMSSLNPIMRIGQQLTEAMILKAETGKKNAAEAFNSLLQLLEKKIISSYENQQATEIAVVSEKVRTFDAFCIENTRIEEIYNEAYTNVLQLEVDIENILLLANKGVKQDVQNEIENVVELLSKSIHPYVIKLSDDITQYFNDLSLIMAKKKEANIIEAIPTLEKILLLAKEAIKKVKPNFFTLAYYKLMNPTADVENVDIEQLNKMTREYLDANFMNDFIVIAEKGVAYAHKEAIKNKKAALPSLRKTLDFFQSGNITEKEAKEYLEVTSALSKQSINRLEVKKKSIEYVYSYALRSAVKAYFDGVKRNPIEEKFI